MPSPTCCRCFIRALLFWRSDGPEMLDMRVGWAGKPLGNKRGSTNCDVEDEMPVPSAVILISPILSNVHSGPVYCNEQDGTKGR